MAVRRTTCHGVILCLVPILKHIHAHFFDTWSPKMAYVLGFLFADGSLDVNPRGSQYFSIQITDKLLLVAIRDAMGSEHKIARRTGAGGARDHFRLQVGSKYMCTQLRRLGVREHKAYTMVLPQLPVGMLPHFVRGYFDGDGNIWLGQVHKKRYTSTTVLHTTFSSCSRGFLVALRDLLHEAGMGRSSLIYSRKAFRLQYSVKDSILLYELMYREVAGGLVLVRKRQVFEQYINMRERS